MTCTGRQIPEKSIITAALLRVVWCKTKLIRGRVAVLQYESPPHRPIHTIFIRPALSRPPPAADQPSLLDRIILTVDVQPNT
jgi:hypothetical protein